MPTPANRQIETGQAREPLNYTTGGKYALRCHVAETCCPRGNKYVNKSPH